MSSIFFSPSSQRIKGFLRSILINSFLGYLIRTIYKDKIPHRSTIIHTPPQLVSNSIVSAIYFKAYERSELKFAKRYIADGETVIELGSSIGVVSSLIGKLKKSKLICVEANPYFIDIIKKNLQANISSDFKIYNRAISPEGPQYFYKGKDNLSGYLSDTKKPGGIQLESITLKEILKENYIDQYSLICDIEGAEVSLLINDKEALNCCNILVIETHNTTVNGNTYTNNDIKKMIETLGFSLEDSYGGIYVFRKIKGQQ